MNLRNFWTSNRIMIYIESPFLKDFFIFVSNNNARYDQ
jgi:hypothetical protein